VKLTLIFLLMTATAFADPLTIQDVPKTVTLSDGRIVPGPSGVICEKGCEQYSSTTERRGKKRAAIVLAVIGVGMIAWAICRQPERWPMMPTPTPGVTPAPQPAPIPEPLTLLLLGSGLFILSGVKYGKRRSNY